MVGRICNYLSTRQGRISFIIVAAFALALSYFCCRTFVEPLTKQYALDFTNAHWIQTATPASAAYFRKTIYLSNDVNTAWLAVSATGVFDVYVNNVFVDHVSFPCARPSQIYDLKLLVSSGKNVIGIRVGPGMYPGAPQVMARAVFRLRGSAPDVPVVSDSTWKVSATPDAIPGSYSWSSPKLDDTLWADAQEAVSGERLSTVQQVAVDPRTITEPLTGKWVEANTTDASFSYGLRIRREAKDNWLQVAANGAHDVLVNDHLVALTPAPTQAVLFGPQAPVNLIGQSRPTVDMPEVVTPWMDMPGVWTLSAIHPSGSKDETENSSALNSVRQPAQIQASSAPDVVAPDQPIAPINLPAGTSASLPDLSEITPPFEPRAPQLIPLDASLGVSQSSAVLTAYNISGDLHPGNNTLIVRVHAMQGRAVLLVDGISAGDGQIDHYGTGTGWVVSASPNLTRMVPASVIGVSGDAPWGLLSQVASTQSWMPGQDLRFFARWSVVIAAVTFASLIFWLTTGWILGNADVPAEVLWNTDAITHLFILVLLLAAIVLNFDVRLPYDWSFRPAVAIGFLLAIPAGKLLLIGLRHRSLIVAPLRDSVTGREYRISWQVLILIAITVAGCIVRAAGMLTESMSHDEVAMAIMSQGVLKNGLPHITTGSFVKYPATYEIVPYPLALSSLFFGSTRFAYRLPALIFGTLTILLVGWVGRRLKDWRVGLSAAFIYAFLPTTIYWSRDGFYLAQEAFFSLATIWLFYEAIRGPELNRRCLMLAAIGAVLSYLSWEGSAFMLLALFVALVVLRWGDFAWITNRYLWRYFLVTSAVVAIQLSYRQLVLTPDYLGAVTDLSDLSTPSLVFLDRAMFDPFIYLKLLFLTESFLPLTLVMIIGLILIRGSRPLAFLGVILLTLLMLYTCFLASYAPRYCYYWIALLVLGGTVSFFELWDSSKELITTAFAARLRAIGWSAALLMLLCIENPAVAKLYRMTLDPLHPPYFGRFGAHYKPDLYSADLYVAKHMLPGDAVIATAPHVFEFDTGRRPDYWMDTMLLQRITYDGGRANPVYVDKWLGIPALRNLREVQEVNGRHRRIWLLEPNVEVNAPDVISYVRMHGRVVHEGFLETVTLLTGADASSETPPTADLRQASR